MAADLELSKLLDFTRLLHDFQMVKRNNLAADSERRENDAEHSYQLAMTAWFLIDKHNLHGKLDVCQVLKYALVHDLPEAIAGDVDRNYASSRQVKKKKDEEDKATARMKDDFPEARSLWESLEKYENEKKSNPEAQFVYALDKLLVFLNSHLNPFEGYTVAIESKGGPSMEEDMKSVQKKVENDHTILEYFKELLLVVGGKEGIVGTDTYHRNDEYREKAATRNPS